MREPFSGCEARLRAARLFAFLFALLPAVLGGQTSDLKHDEEIIFFPVTACRAGDGATWEAEIRGCVFELENRRVALALLRKGLQLKGVKLTAAEEAVFQNRARLFMLDHERSKRIFVRIGKHIFSLNESSGDGMFSGVVQLPGAEVRAMGTNVLVMEAVLPAGDLRRFSGTIALVRDEGITVISDIDDTIKVTSVRDRSAMLRNSFIEPFRAVPGMADLYTSWATNGGLQFFYVSASPWQLYPALAGFVESNGFPAGVFFLKQVRWKGKSLLNLFENPETYKLRTIEPLLERFGNRQFVLVGDSGERDPETYAALARRYPKQVIRILIRDVTEEPVDSPRYREVFRDLPPGLWRIFRHPGLSVCPGTPSSASLL